MANTHPGHLELPSMEWGRKTCSGCLYIHATQLSLLEVSLLSSLMSSQFYSCSWTLGSPCLHKIQALWLRLASYGQECSLACFVIKVYRSLVTPFAEGQIEELWQNCCIRGKAKVFPVWLLADQLLRTGALSTLLCAHLLGSCPHGFREFKGETASVIRIQ